MSIKLKGKLKAPRRDAEENFILIFRVAAVTDKLIHAHEYFLRAFLI